MIANAKKTFQNIKIKARFNIEKIILECGKSTCRGIFRTLPSTSKLNSLLSFANVKGTTEVAA